jgi:sialic acid synthase SpsE
MKLSTKGRYAVMAMADIAKGEKFRYRENVGAFRSAVGGNGDSPMNITNYRGQSAVKDIKAGTDICQHMFE